jgi:hypothetical protein
MNKKADNTIIKLYFIIISQKFEISLLNKAITFTI